MTETSVSGKPKLIGYVDEYLWDDHGAWVSFQPPIFVTPGSDPSDAARSMAIEYNERIHTRRVDLP